MKMAKSFSLENLVINSHHRALNFSIEPFFYTTPMQSVLRMLAGKQRKAPLFVAREQVEGGG